MKNIFSKHFRLLLITGIILIFSQTVSAQKIWSSASAYTLQEKRIQIGLFQPLRYGYSHNMEFSVHPILFFIVPNFEVKWAHGKTGPFDLATSHSFYYPTYLLRTISREGTGGIISPEFDIPHMFAVYNEVIGTMQFRESNFLTLNAGVAIASRFGKLDKRTSIDLPLIYYRLDVFYNKFQLRFGANIQGKIAGRWQYLADGEFFIIPGKENKKAFEHKGLVLWNKSDTFQISAGYKLVYAEYPFGTQWHLLLPLIDIQKAWQRK